MRIPRPYIREEFVRGAATSKVLKSVPFLPLSLILGSVTQPDVYGVS